MRTIILICLAAFTASCQKDATCQCELMQNGVTIESYSPFDYKYKGSYNSNDECMNYAKEQKANNTTQPNTVFECHGQYK